MVVTVVISQKPKVSLAGSKVWGFCVKASGSKSPAVPGK